MKSLIMALVLSTSFSALAYTEKQEERCYEQKQIEENDNLTGWTFIVMGGIGAAANVLAVALVSVPVFLFLSIPWGLVGMCSGACGAIFGLGFVGWGLLKIRQDPETSYQDCLRQSSRNNKRKEERQRF